jgi:hypothetical protein
METAYVTIFSGSSIIVKGLQNRLEDNKIKSITKDRVESARLAGFGADRNAIELVILKTDAERAQPIVAIYKKEINS